MKKFSDYQAVGLLSRQTIDRHPQFPPTTYNTKSYCVRGYDAAVEWSKWMVVYCLTSHSQIFYSYGKATIASEGMQNN